MRGTSMRPINPSGPIGANASGSAGSRRGLRLTQPPVELLAGPPLEDPGVPQHERTVTQHRGGAGKEQALRPKQNRTEAMGLATINLIWRRPPCSPARTLVASFLPACLATSRTERYAPSRAALEEKYPMV